MKISQIISINFNGKIIDSHSHIGNWKNSEGKLYDTTPDIDVFIKAPLENGDTVEKVIVSNLDAMVHKKNENGVIEFLSNEIDANKKLLEVAKNNPKIAAIATCQPRYGNVDNIKKLFEENPNKFIGLKFHPEQLGIAADNEAFKPYMKFAQEKKLPCIFHSGNTFDVKYPDGGIAKASTVSKPEQIYNLAKGYKDVPVIIAHWGGDGAQNYEKTTDIIIQSIKNKDANLYGDISWVDCNNAEKPNLKNIIKRLKAENATDRILFGTDAPLGRFGGAGENGMSAKDAYLKNVKDIKAMIRKEFPDEAEELIDKIFYKNADGLFFKNNQIKVDPEASDGLKNKIKNPSLLLVIGAAAFITGLSAFLYNKAKNHDEHKSSIHRLSTIV